MLMKPLQVLAKAPQVLAKAPQVPAMTSLSRPVMKSLRATPCLPQEGHSLQGHQTPCLPLEFPVTQALALRVSP